MSERYGGTGSGPLEPASVGAPPARLAGQETGADSAHFVALLAELRAVVRGEVRARRGQGTPPERVLMQVKTLLRDAMILEGWLDRAAIDALTALAVSWTIDAYYGG